MHSYHIFRTWILEALTIVLTISLVASIVSILAFYDGKPVPDLGANLNLNALLALLSTILRATLVIIVAQIISQRKWEWYSAKDARPLADLQQFDSGSRGAYGALLLIPTVLSKDRVTLVAAIVLLTSFMVGPCVQQASGTIPCSFPSSKVNASLPFAHWVPRSGMDLLVSGIPPPGIIAAIISSVVSPTGVENQVNVNCPTGNCTFGDLIPEGSRDTVFNNDERTAHSTVGVCNTCTDVSSLLTRKSIPTSKYPFLYSLPNGINISTGARYSDVATMKPSSDLTWMGDLLTDSVREASRWAYVNVTLLNVVSDPVTSSVCSLYPCMRTYSSIVQDNQLHEKEAQSEIMRIQLAEYYKGDITNFNAGSNNETGYASIKSPCRVDGRTFHIGDTLPEYIATTDVQFLDFSHKKYTSVNVTWPDECIYRQNAKFAKAIANVMNVDIFDGFCDWQYVCSKNGVSYGKSNESYLSTVGVGTVLRSLASADTTYSSVTNTFDSIANAMTNRFRFQYGSEVQQYSSTESSRLDLVYGKAWETKVCVLMRMKWLLLPICLTIITIMLSVWTIKTNWQRRHSIPIWKDSILPLLFYCQDIAPRDSKALPIQPSSEDSNEGKTGGLMEASTMAAASRKIMVTFSWSSGEKTDELDVEGMSSTASLLERGSIPLKRRDSRGSSVVHDH
jgi:hypothetical protein